MRVESRKTAALESRTGHVQRVGVVRGTTCLREITESDFKCTSLEIFEVMLIVISAVLLSQRKEETIRDKQEAVRTGSIHHLMGFVIEKQKTKERSRTGFVQNQGNLKVHKAERFS